MPKGNLNDKLIKYAAILEALRHSDRLLKNGNRIMKAKDLAKVCGYSEQSRGKLAARIREINQKAFHDKNIQELIKGHSGKYDSGYELTDESYGLPDEKDLSNINRIIILLDADLENGRMEQGEYDECTETLAKLIVGLEKRKI